jgi:hypothetical protein
VRIYATSDGESHFGDVEIATTMAPLFGDIVLDPNLGSGSALMAAESTDRICRGFEIVTSM